MDIFDFEQKSTFKQSKLLTGMNAKGFN